VLGIGFFIGMADRGHIRAAAGATAAAAGSLPGPEVSVEAAADEEGAEGYDQDDEDVLHDQKKLVDDTR
jgi:hypothetical protein